MDRCSGGRLWSSLVKEIIKRSWRHDSMRVSGQLQGVRWTPARFTLREGVVVARFFSTFVQHTFSESALLLLMFCQI